MQDIWYTNHKYYIDTETYVFLLSAFIGIESRNKFQIKNSMGQVIYFAAEGIYIMSASINFWIWRNPTFQ